MVQWNSVRNSTAAVLTLTVGIVVPAGRAQQFSPTLADTPEVVNSGAGRLRVVPIKGLVYPWALAFLPNGDMLVTEQNLSLIHI